MPTSTRKPDSRRAGAALRSQEPPGPGSGRPPLIARRVDGREQASVSLPSDGPAAGCKARPAPSAMAGHERHGLVAVGPGLPAPVLLGSQAGLYAMNPLPVTGAKIHRPLLRPDVLSRQRLNGWLDEAARGRVVLIIAEAGFGKTTLLADWSRHTERMTAWYRLESDDRDWLTFIRHLVGSGRELHPAFAQETYALLLQLGPGGPTKEDLVTSLAREIPDFASGHPQGFTLILDDYHVVDRSEETDPIVRALLDRTGPGFSLLISSRAAPRLPLSRIRARGGVSRLDGESLCFDVPETDQLFRDAYHQPLAPDVVSDLISRTEGWPALLSLVHTGITRATGTTSRDFIRDLSGAAGDMYDYLAEEVVDQLPHELAEFLTRTSILDEVDVDSSALVVDADENAVTGWLNADERRTHLPDGPGRAPALGGPSGSLNRTRRAARHASQNREPL
jgi:ATP/maltotriose-dependent transcriptional regulator MalT